MSKQRVRLLLALGLAAAAAPAMAATAEIKYVLQCGNAKSVPPDDDDPVLLTRIVAIAGGETQNGEIYVRHFVASGENYTRNKQYRDLRFWSEKGRPTIGQAPQSSFRIGRWSAGSGYTAGANG